ncbi:hypothetical protein FA13DRAFT_1803947 [Coprinellus micaceus]|uniref:DUF6533 domain-containing protein n=1 Tax=Coprinellus micaceus TaxID=71717 RepID=A0A4Y7S9N9_COPMI|nr:hypothetical protein FA13DRAFT_1803947 [Coprinellus micaceus]
MDNATLATLTDLGWAHKHVAYSEVGFVFSRGALLKSNFIVAASTALIAVEIWNSLPDEVSLIWQSEWNIGKFLFLLCRYLVVFDLMLALYYTSTAAATIKRCERLFAAGLVFTVAGVAIAEIILYLRVFALSRNSRWVGAGLVIFFVGFHGTTFVFLATIVRNDQAAMV